MGKVVFFLGDKSKALTAAGELKGYPDCRFYYRHGLRGRILMGVSRGIIAVSLLCTGSIATDATALQEIVETDRP